MQNQSKAQELEHVSIVLNHYKDKLGLTLTAIAQDADCSVSSVFDARKGEVKDRRVNERIARAFRDECRFANGKAAALAFMRDYLDAYSQDVFGLPLSALLPPP